MVLPKIDEIKDKRRSLGLTQEALAKEAKVSRVLISQIENNHHFPSYDTAKYIFDFLEREEANRIKKGKTAGKICVSPLVSVSSNNTIKTVKARMGSRGNYSQLPVIDNGACVGVITVNSILETPGAKRVKDAMKDKPPIISEDEIVTLEIRNLLKQSYCILVSERKSNLIKGIITEWDLLNKLYDKWA